MCNSLAGSCNVFTIITFVVEQPMNSAIKKKVQSHETGAELRNHFDV